MESSGINRSGVQSLLQGDGSKRVGSSEQKQVPFSSGTRTVVEKEPTVSIKTTDSGELPESSPDNKSIDEFKIDDVTDQKPGKLREGLSWLSGKVKSKAVGLKDSVASKGAAVARGTVKLATNPKTTLGHAAVDSAVYLQGKYTSAKSKGATAKQAIGDGLKALKENPKETLKAGGARVGSGLKSIKDRAVSLPKNVKSKIPERPKGFSLPSLKSLFSRSAKPVPPSPSASVKAAVDLSTKKTDQFTTQLTQAKDSVQQEKTAKTNLQNLSKLLDDPGDFYKSGVELDVQWGGETIHIGGEGLNRARSVKSAQQLAQTHQKEIRSELKGVDQRIETARTSKRELKEKNKTETQELHEKTAIKEESEYSSQLSKLKDERTSLKKKLSLAKEFLKEAVSKGKGHASSTRSGLKAQLKVDRELLKALKGKEKGERSRVDQETKTIRQGLKKATAEIEKYESN